jgi:LAO/AO transport system kinase
LSDPTHNINPHYKKHPAVSYTVAQCIEGIKLQNPIILSYLISKAESRRSEDHEMLYTVLQDISDTGHSRVIALSGAPGVGKSTFVNSYGQHIVDKGYKIAVLPVDPSSNISRGSILGDKTRMEDIVTSDQVYIKPMPSSLSVGGVAPASFLATHICRLAQFDYIFLETVGVGQSEYEARHLADIFILLLQPGGGDDLQGIKRGIMEMADILLVNKADGELKAIAHKSLDAYRQSLRLMLPNTYGWKARSGLYSSMDGGHVRDLDDNIQQYYSFMSAEARLYNLRKEQKLRYFDLHYKEILIQQILNSNNLRDTIESLRDDITNDILYPYIALQKLKALTR